MDKKLTLFLIFCLLTTSVFAKKKKETPEESFRKHYPQYQFESIKLSPIEGLYEVVVGNNIFYYNQKTNYLVYGSIISQEGKNLTLQKREEIMTQRIKEIPLEQALKIGEGPNTVIVINDPDCPFSRKTADFFRGRNDVTQYVFFLPLPMHASAEKKIKYILCSENKSTAYDEILQGKLDGKELTSPPACEEQIKSAWENNKQIVQKLGVNSTPTLWINGQFVQGADIARIESILKGVKQ